MEFKRKKGFTLIELIMVIVIIGAFSFTGAYVMSFLLQSTIYVPNQLNMDMISSDAINIMIEGDSQAKGLRFSKLLLPTLQNTEVTFVNTDNQTVRFRLVTGTNKLYRSINGGAEVLIPYYTTPNINMATNDQLFKYYDATETITAFPDSVRWIVINLVARTGGGAFGNWQGQSGQSSSVAVKRYQ